MIFSRSAAERGVAAPHIMGLRRPLRSPVVRRLPVILFSCSLYCSVSAIAAASDERGLLAALPPDAIIAAEVCDIATALDAVRRSRLLVPKVRSGAASDGAEAADGPLRDAAMVLAFTCDLTFDEAIEEVLIERLAAGTGPVAFGLVPIGHAGAAPVVIVSGARDGPALASGSGLVIRAVGRHCVLSTSQAVVDLVAERLTKVSPIAGRSRADLRVRIDVQQLLARRPAAGRPLMSVARHLAGSLPKRIDVVYEAGREVVRLHGLDPEPALGLPAAHNCPCCQSPFGPAARSARDEALACATQGIYQARASDRAFQDQQDRLSALRDEATRLKAALPPTIFTDVLGGTDLDLSSELRDVTAALQATLEDQQARRVSAAAPQMARQRAEAAATRADVLKEAADAWEKAQSQVVESALAGLVAQASSYFPARFGTAKIKLRPSVDVGIDREGAVGAPSGAEEAILMLALAAALSDSAADSGYDLLVMEDRAVDPQSVDALLTSLSAWSTGQLFVQAIAQVGTMPGWTIHRFHREASGAPLASAALVKLAALRRPILGLPLDDITAADVSLISPRDADAT